MDVVDTGRAWAQVMEGSYEGATRQASPESAPHGGIFGRRLVACRYHPAGLITA